MISKGKAQNSDSDDFETDLYTKECQPPAWVRFDFKSRINQLQRCVIIVKTPMKEKPMLMKLPYGTVICVLSCRLPAKVAGLFCKTNEAE